MIRFNSGTRIRFTSLASVEAHKWAGNFFEDSGAFDAVEYFVKDSNNSIADRAEALRIAAHRGMGCDREEDVADATLVAAFIRDCPPRIA